MHENPSRSAVSKILRLACLAPCCIQSHFNYPSSPLWCSVWSSAHCLEHVCMLKCIELLPYDQQAVKQGESGRWVYFICNNGPCYSSHSKRGHKNLTFEAHKSSPSMKDRHKEDCCIVNNKQHSSCSRLVSCSCLCWYVWHVDVPASCTLMTFGESDRKECVKPWGTGFYNKGM